MLKVANPLPVLLPMAADLLATVFAAVAISLMEQREGGRKGERQEGRKGDFAVVYHRGRSRITTLESQMADRPNDRPTDLGPLLPLSPSLKGGIEVNERE